MPTRVGNLFRFNTREQSISAELDQRLTTPLTYTGRNHTLEQGLAPASKIPNYRIDPQNLMTFDYRPPTSSDFVIGDGLAPALVNPTSIADSVEPVYSKRPVLGLSHEVVQYVRTASRSMSFQLWISYHVMQQRGLLRAGYTPLDYRNFWQGLCVPYGPGLPPPLVRADAPGMKLNITGVVTSLAIQYQYLSVSGEPMDYTIDITIVEAPTGGLMTTEKVFMHGINTAAYDAR